MRFEILPHRRRSAVICGDPRSKKFNADERRYPRPGADCALTQAFDPKFTKPPVKKETPPLAARASSKSLLE
jgi:hypothetical protein